MLRAFGANRAVINNGAAGMPNFEGSDYGLVTRISVDPCADALYATRLGLLHVEAVPIRYDARAWRAAFLSQWPAGSDAHASYFRRIADGPRHRIEDAVRAPADQGAVRSATVQS